jgi:hypothetical protein
VMFVAHFVAIEDAWHDTQVEIQIVITQTAILYMY